MDGWQATNAAGLRFGKADLAQVIQELAQIVDRSGSRLDASQQSAHESKDDVPKGGAVDESCHAEQL